LGGTPLKSRRAQGHVDQPVEELVHPRATERDLRPDGHALPELEIRDDFLARVITGFCPLIAWRSAVAKVEDLWRLSRPSPTPMLITDLVEPRNLHVIRVSALLEEPRHDRLMEALLETRGDLSRALWDVSWRRGRAASPPLRGWPLAAALPCGCWARGFWAGALGAFAML